MATPTDERRKGLEEDIKHCVEMEMKYLNESVNAHTQYLCWIRMTDKKRKKLASLDKKGKK